MSIDYCVHRWLTCEGGYELVANPLAIRTLLATSHDIVSTISLSRPHVWGFTRCAFVDVGAPLLNLSIVWVNWASTSSAIIITSGRSRLKSSVLRFWCKVPKNSHLKDSGFMYQHCGRITLLPSQPAMFGGGRGCDGIAVFIEHFGYPRHALRAHRD